MSSLTAGYGGTFSNVNFGGNLVYTQMASGITMPQDGVITHINFFLGGRDGAINARGVIWNWSGAVMGQTPLLHIPHSSSTAANGQHWNYSALESPVVVSAGQTICVGWWRPPSGHPARWSWATVSGITSWWQDANASAPVGLNGVNGLIEAYSNRTLGVVVYYYPLGPRVWNGSSWVRGRVRVWNGSSWVNGRVRAWNGSHWADIN